MKILERGDLHTALAQRAQLEPEAVALIITHDDTAYIYRWSPPMKLGDNNQWRQPIHHTDIDVEAKC